MFRSDLSSLALCFLLWGWKSAKMVAYCMEIYIPEYLCMLPLTPPMFFSTPFIPTGVSIGFLVLLHIFLLLLPHFPPNKFLRLIFWLTRPLIKMDGNSYCNWLGITVMAAIIIIADHNKLCTKVRMKGQKDNIVHLSPSDREDLDPQKYDWWTFSHQTFSHSKATNCRWYCIICVTELF